jgi:gliding motility-associated-like protein
MKPYLFFISLQVFFAGISSKAFSQVTLAFQGGETGDTWTFTSTGAATFAETESFQAPNKVTGTRSLVVGGNTGGGNCFGSTSGNGAAVARTFSFTAFDISSSNESVRTLRFNWGNRFPGCNGTGWDAGENLVFTAYHDEVQQMPSATLAVGSGNAQYSIQSNQFVYQIPACVNSFRFTLSITTNRADELLFIDNVTLTAPQINTSTQQPSAISGNVSVCQGSTEAYSVTDVTSADYTWSGLPAGASFTTPNGNNSITVNWGTALPGSYALTVTPSGSCGTPGTPRTVNVTILGAPAPVTISGPTSVCAGQSITLTSSYATGNDWSTTETSQSISVSSPGTYSVTVQTQCGTTSASQTVSAAAATTAAITSNGPTTFCDGQSISLTSNSAAGNSWSTGETTQSIMVTASGIYTLTVTGACGTANDSETITVNPLPSAAIAASGPLSFCEGGSVTLTASGGDTYQWSSGQTVPAITVTQSGTFTVTATNSCGQSVSSPVTVNVTPLPDAQISGNTSFCAGSTVTLTASGGSTYLWSSGQTTAAITVSTAGTYTVTATNSCGQDVSAPFTVTEIALPDAQITGPAALCQGNTITLTASGGNSYLWSNGATTATISISSGGTFTVTATNACGQDISAPFTVNSTPLPDAQIAGNTSFCEGSTVTLTASGGSTYQWSSGQTTASVTISAGGTFTVTATNSCGQDVSAPFTVAELPLPNAQITGPNTLCQGSSITLTASGGDSYLWSNGSTSSTITVSSAGTFTLGASNSCGQDVSAPFIVTLTPLPVAQISGDASFCEGEQSVLTASGGTSYQWSSGENTAAITVTESGVYTVTAANSCGSDTESITVVVSSVDAAFSANPNGGQAPLNVVFTNETAGNITSSAWDFGDGFTSADFSTQHTYNLTGLYSATLTVISQEGCTDSESILIEVVALPSSVTVPNVFTPNGDGANDVFMVGFANLTDFRLQLIDRWGNTFAELTDPQAGWDGSINGDDAVDGTYFYKLSATGADSVAYEKSGFFVLQR